METTLCNNDKIAGCVENLKDTENIQKNKKYEQKRKRPK